MFHFKWLPLYIFTTTKAFYLCYRNNLISKVFGSVETGSKICAHTAFEAVLVLAFTQVLAHIFYVHLVTGTYLFLAVLPWDVHMPFRVLTRRRYPPCLEHSMCMTSPERKHVPRNLPGQPQSCAPTSCLCTYFDRVSTLLNFFPKIYCGCNSRKTT